MQIGPQMDSLTVNGCMDDFERRRYHAELIAGQKDSMVFPGDVPTLEQLRLD